VFEVLDEGGDRPGRDQVAEELRLAPLVARRLLGRSVLGQPALGLTVRHRLGGFRVDVADAEQVDPVGPDDQARRGLLRRVGRDALPPVDQRRGLRQRVRDVEALRRRGGDGLQRQARHDPELPAAGAAQRPQQVAVGLDHVSAREHDLRARHLITGQPVSAPKHPEPSAERQAGDADGGAAAARDGSFVRRERVVDGCESCSRPDRDNRGIEGDGVEAAGVDEDSARARPAGEAMPAAADREGLALTPRQRQRLYDVCGAAAPRDQRGLDVREPLDLRFPSRVVSRGSGSEHLHASELQH